MTDLVQCLGLPDAIAGFNDRLKLDISTTGKSNTLATFNATRNTITLRRDGVGSLAHEWGHFFDHVLGKLNYVGGEFLSDDASRARRLGVTYPEDTRAAQIERLYASPAYASFRERMLHSDDFQNGGIKHAQYLASPTEMWARMFEAHVSDKLAHAGQSNTYLVSNLNADSGIYPNAIERVALAPYFDKVFDAFKNSDLLHKAIRYFISAAPASTFTIPNKG